MSIASQARRLSLLHPCKDGINPWSFVPTMPGRVIGRGTAARGGLRLAFRCAKDGKLQNHDTATDDLGPSNISTEASVGSTRPSRSVFSA